MSAHAVGSGANAHAELQALGQLVQELDEPLEIRLPAEPAPHQRRLIEALGGRIVLDARAPAHCHFKPSGARKLTRVERAAAGLHVYQMPRRLRA